MGWYYLPLPLSDQYRARKVVARTGLGGKRSAEHETPGIASFSDAQSQDRRNDMRRERRCDTAVLRLFQF